MAAWNFHTTKTASTANPHHDHRSLFVKGRRLAGRNRRGTVMTDWESQRKTCMHGVREGLDRHDCPACWGIAKQHGYDVSDGKTYIFFSIPAVSTERKRTAAVDAK